MWSVSFIVLYFTSKSGENRALTCTCRTHGSCLLSSVPGKCPAYAALCSAWHTRHSWGEKTPAAKSQYEYISKTESSSVVYLKGQNGSFISLLPHCSGIMDLPLLQTVLKVAAVGPSIRPLHGTSGRDKRTWTIHLTAHTNYKSCFDLLTWEKAN